MFIQCGEPFSLSWIKFVTNYKYNGGHKNNNNYTIRWHHQMAPKGLYLSSSFYSTFTPHKYQKKSNKITNYRKLSGCKDRPNNRHCHHPRTTTNCYDLRKSSSALFLSSVVATKCDLVITMNWIHGIGPRLVLCFDNKFLLTRQQDTYHGIATPNLMSSFRIPQTTSAGTAATTTATSEWARRLSWHHRQQIKKLHSEPAAEEEAS